MSISVIPKDPVILYSFLNTKLRDQYSSFSLLCEDMELNEEEILSILKTMDFHYDAKKNQFR